MKKTNISGDQGVKWTPCSFSRLAYQGDDPRLVVGEDDRKEWECHTSFNLHNLQIMTGQSGSQGEGIS